MINLESNIIIGKYDFKGVHAVEIDSSWDNLTDTCEIVFPRKVAWQGKNLATGSDPILKRKQAVSVELGYKGDTSVIFTGFVRDVSAEIPVKINCEDGMYLLKTGEITRSYRSVTLSKLLADVVGGVLPFKVTAEYDLGQFRISKATPAKVLQHLREHYLIRCWVRGGILYAGLPYVSELQKEHSLDFNRNVISHNLEYREKDDIRLSLKAQIVKPGNGSETVEVPEGGDPDGEQRTFHYYNVSKSEAKKMLEQEAERLKYTGYRGTLTTFGTPQIQHGDFVNLNDPTFPERAGRYLVKKVKTSFGMNGYRQEIELESKK